MPILIYTLGVLGLSAGLVVFSYLDRVYRELGRVTTGRVHDHLDQFETEIEPRFKMDRPRANLAFSLLALLWLVLVAAVTARGVIFFVPGTWEAAVEMVFFLSAEVVIAMQLLPYLLLAGVRGSWVGPLVPAVRIFVWIIWPGLAILEGLFSILHLSEEETAAPAEVEQQQAIEALVDAATEEGIIEQDDARLIEQVVEFGDKRVREVMTPRPDVVAIPASATLEELRDLAIETKFSRIPVYEKSLDDIVGIVFPRDVLEVPEREAAHRNVRELMRPVLFVPEMKFGSELLKEMQRKNQQMAVVIDEYGLMAGVVTVEDLVEEIVGEIGDEHEKAQLVQENEHSYVVPGSMDVDRLDELFGRRPEGHESSTIAGLVSELAGRIPKKGEVVEEEGLRFEVLDSTDRRVERVRITTAEPKQLKLI